MVDDQSYTGYRALTSDGSDHNIARLHIESAMDERRTMVPAKIVKVTGGGDGPAPFADVQPLIDQVDGLGARTPHKVISNLPVARNHSGNGAIINDPQPNDLVMVVVADRDISTLKKTSDQAAPGSKRRGSLSDGVVHHALLNQGKPKQHVMFKDDGVKITDLSGNVVETFKDKIVVNPKDGNMVILGGDGSKGSYGFVMTDAGTSGNVKAKVG